jgi:hypothetical protein
MIAYYAREAALPGDIAALNRIAAAQTPAERKAAQVVADRFFPLGEDGFRHNGRADREIAKAQKRINAARENGTRGGRPGKPNDNPPGNPTGIPSGNPLGTPSVTQPGEALQTPHATTTFVRDTPDTPAAPAGSMDRTGQFEGHPDAKPPAPNPVAAFAIVLNAAGFRCTSMNPDLCAYVAAGGTVDHLRQVLALPECAGKPAAYAIRIAQREIAEAPPTTNGEPHGQRRRPGESLADAARRAIDQRPDGTVVALIPLAGAGAG